MNQMVDRYALNKKSAKISEKDSINSKAVPTNHVGYLLDQGIILNYSGPWQAEKFSNKIEL